jgi:hypothetical protein
VRGIYALRKLKRMESKNMNHFKFECGLIIVTDATKVVVERAVKLIRVASEDIVEELGIDEICNVLKRLGYKATWDNYSDMELLKSWV